MSEIYNSYATKLNDSSETIILIPPSGGTSLVKGIHISNTIMNSGLAVNINLYKNEESYSIITSGLVPIQTSFQVLDVPIPVTSGDLIKAQANASGLHIIVSTLELT